MSDPDQIVFRPQPGPQTVFAESDADICIYGGAAGSGKSHALCYEGVKHIDVEGYQGAFFRRTSPELQGAGSLWEEALTIYPHLGGIPRGAPFLDWRFPTPRTLLQFKHMQHEKTAENEKSKQYAFVGIDELCDFTEVQFWKLVSRLRTRCGLKPRMRCSCNPDPTSFVRHLLAWWIGPDGFPIESRAGVKRYFIRKGKTLIWGDTEDELLEYASSKHAIMSLCFVPAKLSDNRKLLDIDPSYQGKLENLPPAERARFLYGSWSAVEGSGTFFQRGWFVDMPTTDLESRVRALPLRRDFVHRIRMYDLASTPVEGDLVPGVKRPDSFSARDPSESNPDWTVGNLVALTRDKKHLWWEDSVSYRDASGAIEELIIRQAIIDGPGVVIGLWQDPGQAGVWQIEHLAETLPRAFKAHGGRTVWVERAAANKTAYASVPSRKVYQGQVLIDRTAPWYTAAMNLLEAFPDPKEVVKDDIIDALSGAFLYLLRDSPGHGDVVSVPASTHPLPAVRSAKRTGLDKL